MKWERVHELVSHRVSYLLFLQGPFVVTCTSFPNIMSSYIVCLLTCLRVFSQDSCSADYFCLGACFAKANMLTTPWNTAVMKKQVLSRSQHITELCMMKSLVYLYVLWCLFFLIYFSVTVDLVVFFFFEVRLHGKELLQQSFLAWGKKCLSNQYLKWKVMRKTKPSLKASALPASVIEPLNKALCSCL